MKVRIIVQPMIVWLWAGGAVMAIGSVLAAFPGRRRRGTEPVSAPAVAEAASPPPEPEPIPVGAGS